MNKELTECEKSLRMQVNRISKDLSEGMTYEEAGLDHEGRGYDKDDIVSAFDYLEDVLDIQYIVNSDKSYRAAKILVCFGGPNIWINTDTMTVDGYWWGDEYHAGFTDKLGLDEALEEYYNCI